MNTSNLELAANKAMANVFESHIPNDSLLKRLVEGRLTEYDEKYSAAEIQEIQEYTNASVTAQCHYGRYPWTEDSSEDPFSGISGE